MTTVTDAYLKKAEAAAKKFKGVLAPYVTTLAAEVRRLRVPPPPPTPPPTPTPTPHPLVSVINRRTAEMVAGSSPAVHRSVYSIQDPYTPRFARNPSCWINAVTNLTCFSPAQLSGTPWFQRAGTLVTRRHVVCAAHYGIPIIDGGTPIHFVTRDNAVVTRRVVACLNDGPSDIYIGLLDDEVPPSIAIAPVLPSDFERHLGSRNAILAVGLDAEEKTSLTVCDTFFNDRFSVSALNSNWMPPEFKALAACGERVVAGDSGNPVFIIIDSELVLLGCWWSASDGPHVGARHELVNRMIEKLSPGMGYRLTTKQL